MEHLDDELDLRYHKGFDPDVYYRCPTLESLAGALRNEVDKNAYSLIPTDLVTEFVFAPSSTITIPVTQQLNLDALIEPAGFLQSIAVEYALCRDIAGKERLRVQRAIARSIIEAIRETDGYEYSERSAQNRDGSDGARFRFVCRDSIQNRYRKSNMKKDASHDSEGSDVNASKNSHGMLPTYDCGGAIYIKFSLKREAINVVYKHNPIHAAHPTAEDPPPSPIHHHVASPPDAVPEKQPRKRRRGKEAEADVENQHRNADRNMPASPGNPKSSAKKRKREGATPLPKPARTASSKQSTKAESFTLPTQSRKKASTVEESKQLPDSVKACIRCRKKKIKCNRAEPSCDQCRRGLWTCQYTVPAKKQRSRNGCLNCKQRKRKCTQEKPACAHCLRTDDDCEYADYSSLL